MGVMKTDNQTMVKVKPSHLKIIFFALVIFSIALLVRYIGLNFAFPLLTHPDEGIIMNRLRNMSVEHSLDPRSYPYPAFPSYYSKFIVLNALSKLRFGMNYGLGYWQDPLYFYTVSRLMTAVQGALLPVVAWFIGRKFKQSSFSWVAAVLFTFYPVFVLHSHYVTVDIPLTLLSCLYFFSA